MEGGFIQRDATQWRWKKWKFSVFVQKLPLAHIECSQKSDMKMKIFWNVKRERGWKVNDGFWSSWWYWMMFWMNGKMFLLFFLCVRWMKKMNNKKCTKKKLKKSFVFFHDSYHEEEETTQRTKMTLLFFMMGGDEGRGGKLWTFFFHHHRRCLFNVNWGLLERSRKSINNVEKIKTLEIVSS